MSSIVNLVDKLAEALKLASLSDLQNLSENESSQFIVKKLSSVSKNGRPRRYKKVAEIKSLSIPQATIELVKRSKPSATSMTEPDHPFLELYVEIQYVSSEIKRRLLLRSFYSFMVRYGYHTGMRWTSKAVDGLVDCIKGHCSEDEAKIKRNIQRYAELGRGFAAWLKELEEPDKPGYLMMMPPEVSENEYDIYISWLVQS